MNNCTPRNTYYKESLIFFEQMVNSCSNQHLFKEIYRLMRDRHMVHIASRGIHNHIRNSKGTTLFGENNTNKISMKRHKFIHEE